MSIKSRAIDTLNAKSIAAIKSNGKRQLFHDGNYLYLSVSAKGAKSFYFRGYTFNGKRVNEFSLGTYRKNTNDNGGDLTLAEARDKAREVMRSYRAGIDYHQQQKQAKLQATFEQANTLDDWFNRWFETKVDKSESTKRDYQGRYAKWISPRLGKQSIVALSNNEAEIEQLYQYIQTACSSEMAKRCHIILGGIFKLAQKKKIIRSNPSEIAKDEIKHTKQTNFPAITQGEDIGKLMLDIETTNVTASTKYALRLIPYLMLRPANVVQLEWQDIDLEQRIIIIDADRMKTGNEHCVPYPTQVAEILTELKNISGHSKYLFPGHKGDSHIHRDTLSKALRVMGYAGKHTPHGFRAMATTWLYDQRYYSYAIEKQLAHTEGNKVVRAYSRDDTMRYLKDRRKMLQDYADHIDQLREQARSNTALMEKVGANINQITG